jgi:cardiolipin synthase
MKPRLFIAVSLAVVWVLVLVAFLQRTAPVSSSPAAHASTAPLDVVINEVAWAGTAANYNHEWIELKNNLPLTLNLSNWRLRSSDGSPSVTLSGEIAPLGYFLMARTYYTDIVDVVIDQTFTGGLNDAGEALTLTDALGNVIDTANGDGGGWPAGTGGSDTPPRASMERINPLAPDTDSNWASNDGIIRNGHDANGNPINGTPKQPNSAAPAELSIIKSAPEVALTNHELTYTLWFVNVGGKNATGVVITDFLPVSVTLITQTSSCVFTQTGQMLGWQIGSLSSYSGTISFTIVVSPETDLTGWLTNTAVITSEVADYRPGNNAYTATTWIRPPLADVGIAKNGPDSVNAGSELTYTIVFSNTGETDAANVVITDTLPLSVTFLRGTEAYSFSQPVSGTLVWMPDSVPIGGLSSSLTVVVQAASEASGWLVNQVTITTATSETVVVNNTAAFTTQITTQSADLGVAKSGPISVTAGAEITYTIVVSNIGQLAATGVHVTDTLPVSVTFVRQTAPYTFTRDSRVLTWDVDNVPVSAALISWTVTGLVDARLTGTMTNALEATTTAHEVITDNNSDEATTLVVSPPPAVIPPHVLISAVHGYAYNTYEDEAIQLTNVGTQTVSLLNWRLTEGDKTGVTLPTIEVAPGQRIWVTKNATAFRDFFGAWPDLAVITAGTAMPLTGTWPTLPNAGGDVQLTGTQVLQDRMLYGSATAIPGRGWESAAVQPYTPTTAFAQAGQILYRKLDEVTGLPDDTDTSADWAQDRADPIAGRRVRYPGWNLEQFYRTVQITQTAWLTVGIAPDNAFDVISQVIASAQQTLTIAVYSFENAALAELLAARARAGVSVTLLLEGEPAGGLTDQEKWSCQQVETEGGACWFMFNDTTLTPKVYDRYSNQHAKVIVADDRLASIGSENLSPRSLPDDDKSDGTTGQRGVVLVTDAPGVVQAARRIWTADFDPMRFRDLTRWSSSGDPYGPPPIGFAPITVTGGTTYTVLFPQPVILSGTFPFEVIQSPDNSLRQSDSLLGLIGRASLGDGIAVEQLQEPPHWGPTSSTPTSDPNVFLEALIAAASRGARVRILMDSYFDDGDNAATVAYVENLRAENPTLRANLQARLGNPTALGIHNKMLLASIAGRGYAHIGSLNHGELAAKGNREVAVQVESQNLYTELMRVFQADWNWSAPTFLPLVMREYEPPDHILISEVYYSNSVTLQWVELYNPMSTAVSLADWKIGDAETPQRYEGMYRFPSGTVIGPGGVLVVAYDGTQVPQANFQMCQNCGGSALVLPKYTSWGSGDWTLAGHGDQILLMGSSDVPVDVVVYGDAVYPGVVAHQGVSVYTHSLERFPASSDTDDCAADFRDRYPPTPGEVP